MICQQGNNNRYYFVPSVCACRLFYPDCYRLSRNTLRGIVRLDGPARTAALRQPNATRWFPTVLASHQFRSYSSQSPTNTPHYPTIFPLLNTLSQPLTLQTKSTSRNPPPLLHSLSKHTLTNIPHPAIPKMSFFKTAVLAILLSIGLVSAAPAMGRPPGTTPAIANILATESITIADPTFA